jgi:hypothetical protein
MFVCETCKKTFARKENLKIHGNVCKGYEIITPHKCNFCLKFYSTKYNLNTHLDTCKKKKTNKKGLTKIEKIKKKLEEKERRIERLEKLNNIQPSQSIINNNIINNDNRVTNNTVVNNLILAGAEPLDLSLERFLKIVDKNYTYETLAKFRLFVDLIKPFYSNEQGKVVAVLTDVDRMKIKCLDLESKPVTHSPEDITAMFKNDIVLNKTNEYISQLKEEDKNLGLKARRATTDSKKMKSHVSNNNSTFLKKNANIRFVEH